MLNVKTKQMIIKMNSLGILSLVPIILFGIIFISMNSFEQAWAQDSTFANDLITSTFFSEEGRLLEFLFFVIGIALYSLFVWYFYRFISKRDLLPKIFYPLSHGKKATPKLVVAYSACYIIVFPIITFVWFIVLAFFVFLISKEMPFEIALFVSMAIIAVVRILSYYRETAASEIAKMIPYAILSFFLTSVAVFAEPSFFTEKQFGSIPIKVIENLGGIVSAMAVVSIFEFTFRIAFIVKRKFLPSSDKKLEETIETEVEEIAKAHFKKIEEKEKQLEGKIDELMKKLKDSEKTNL
jgi:hypothetical protein